MKKIYFDSEYHMGLDFIRYEGNVYPIIRFYNRRSNKVMVSFQQWATDDPKAFALDFFKFLSNRCGISNPIYRIVDAESGEDEETVDLREELLEATKEDESSDE